MKRCPTCQKTFDDNKRFCQVDGTPLVDDAPSESVDPYKTVVGGQFPKPPAPDNSVDNSMKTMVVTSDSSDEDPLQIPEVFDPMKTVVGSDIKKEIPPSSPKEPEQPKFSEPSLNPPSFGDLSSYSPEKETPKASEPPKFDSPFSSNEPPKQSPPSLDKEQPKFGSPFSTPNEQPKFGSPFDREEEKPKNDPFPPFKDTTSPLGEKKDPFQNSAFGLPQTPLEQSYTPPAPAFNPPPMASQQDDWSAPPPPIAGWENQEIGQNTPFNPPVAGSAGQNQTLGIVTLVLGIVSLLCLGFLTGIPAMITGYLTLKNVKNDPVQYGGKVLAIVGMVLAALGILWSVLYAAFLVFAIVANAV